MVTMLTEQLVNSFHDMVDMRTKVIGSEIEYTPEELMRELRSGTLGWIKPDIKIETELSIFNDCGYGVIDHFLTEMEKITDSLGILYTTIIATENAEIPDKPGIVHIVRIR